MRILIVEDDRKLADFVARMPAPALSQQAAILDAEGLIGRRREGRSVLYRLHAPEVKLLAKLLYRLFCKPSAASARRGGRGRAHKGDRS